MDVLIVEDTSGMLQLLQHAVETRGHTATTRPEGRCAIEVFELASYPLILLDWEMPGMSGIEPIPVILALPGGWKGCQYFTGDRQQCPDDLRQALVAGADDHISKPFEYDLLDVRLTVAEQQCKVRADRYRFCKNLENSYRHLATSKEDCCRNPWRPNLGRDPLIKWVGLYRQPGPLLRPNQPL